MNMIRARCARRASPVACAGLALGLMMPLTGGAHGAITVTADPAIGLGPNAIITNLGANTYRVELSTTVVAQPTTFFVRGSTTDKIENLLVTANVPQMVFLDVRGLAAGTSLTSVDLVDSQSSSATVVLQDLRTSGAVGSIRVNTISNMTVGGDVTGEIRLRQRGGGGESTLINATVLGRIRGDVLADFGAIFFLNANGGIGTVMTPVQVRTKNNIVSLVASEIFANVTTLASGGAGVVGRLETTFGSFTGSLITRSIRSTGAGEPGVLKVAGNLDASVTITEDVRNENSGQPVINVSGMLPLGRTLSIGTTLAAGAQVQVGAAAGLGGRVIINSRNLGGAWSGSVRVGASTLGPVPAYSATTVSLGGGSVGQVPFALHAADSFPAAGAVMGVAAAPSLASPIRLRHYGPITWAAGAPIPVIVERRPIGSTGAWDDRTAFFFVGPDPAPIPSPTIIAVYPSQAITGGFVYRVRPLLSGATSLRCDLGLAPNPAVADYAPEYSFTVLPPACPGDADASNSVNFADISSVLTNWGGAGPNGDANHDGAVNFADISSVLTNWGAPC